MTAAAQQPSASSPRRRRTTTTMVLTLWMLLSLFASTTITVSFVAVEAFQPAVRRRSSSGSWIQQPRTPQQLQASPSDSSTTPDQQQQQQSEHLKQDIAALKRQAASRLDSLLQQMEELRELNRARGSSSSAAVTATTKQEKESNPEPPQPKKKVTVVEDESAAGTDSDDDSLQPSRIIPPVSLLKKTKKTNKAAAETAHPAEQSSTTATTTAASLEQQQQQQQSAPAAQLEIARAPAAALDETVWKIVFNIGREPGSWFPPPWGASGDRLLFQCTVDFTGTPVDQKRQQHLHDEFFHARDRICQLQVSDAFVVPRGVGAHSVGRRPLPVKPTGAYRVCRGQGPAGTDIVRLFIELTEAVHVPDHASDVHCPAGRVYGTCGFFAVPTMHAANETSYRDEMQRQHTAALRHLEGLQQKAALDEQTSSGIQNNLLNLEHWQIKKDMWKAQQLVEKTAKQLALAKQQEPEKSQLRLSKLGDVGLSREGGVCCKVHKGLALEYHILGRMEVGCVEDHHQQ